MRPSYHVIWEIISFVFFDKKHFMASVAAMKCRLVNLERMKFNNTFDNKKEDAEISINSIWKSIIDEILKP